MFYWWFGLTCAIVALVFTRQTKWYELVLLGAWGVLTGGLAVGATSWSQILTGIGPMFGRLF
jgi:hypothetical protein